MKWLRFCLSNQYCPQKKTKPRYGAFCYSTPITLYTLSSAAGDLLNPDNEPDNCDSSRPPESLNPSSLANRALSFAPTGKLLSTNALDSLGIIYPTVIGSPDSVVIKSPTSVVIAPMIGFGANEQFICFQSSGSTSLIVALLFIGWFIINLSCYNGRRHD